GDGEVNGGDKGGDDGDGVVIVAVEVMMWWR
ncbi:hypothetical protein Tco_0919246, partial [Tanacetum coccineum]